jgi:hypothetical protein
MMFSNKRGLVFIVDVLLGFAIVIIGISLLLVFLFEVPVSTQPDFYADDIVLFLTSTQFDDFQTNSSKALLKSSIVTEDTLIGEQISLWCDSNDQYSFDLLLNETVVNILPRSLRYSVTVINNTINETTCLSHTPYPESSKESAQIISVSRGMLLGILNNTEILGPYYLEVSVW